MSTCELSKHKTNIMFHFTDIKDLLADLTTSSFLIYILSTIVHINSNCYGHQISDKCAHVDSSYLKIL